MTHPHHAASCTLTTRPLDIYISPYCKLPYARTSAPYFNIAAASFPMATVALAAVAAPEKQERFRQGAPFMVASVLLESFLLSSSCYPQA